MPAGYFNFTGPQRIEIGVDSIRQFLVATNLTEAEKHAIADGTVTEAQQASIDAKTRNLTGCTAETIFSTEQSGGTVVLTLTTENGGHVLGGTAGTIRFVFTEENTSGIPAGEYYYRTRLIASGGDRERLLQGRAVADPEAP